MIEDRIQRFKDWISKEIFSIYVYENDTNGVIKGMMGFGKCGDEDKTEAFELHFIYIETAFSRKGIGRKMLNFFEKEGEVSPCARTSLRAIPSAGEHPRNAPLLPRNYKKNMLL